MKNAQKGQKRTAKQLRRARHKRAPVEKRTDRKLRNGWRAARTGTLGRPEDVSSYVVAGVDSRT